MTRGAASARGETSALNDERGDQARAEQREAGRSQCQQAARDKLMIAHGTHSRAAQGER